MSMSKSKLLRIVISAGLLLLVLTFADWKEVGHVLRSVDVIWLVCAFVLAFGDRVVTNYRWQILLRARGVQTSFMKLFRIQLAANFLGSFLPSSVGVDAVRIAALCRQGEAAPPVIAATLVDRISLALATMLLGALMLLFFAQSFIPEQVRHMVFAATVVVLALGAFSLRKSVRSWVRLTLLPKVPERFRQTLHDVADAALTYRTEHAAMVKLLLVTLLTFLVRIYFAKTVALAVGLDLSILRLLLVIPILWIIVMLPITIGGIGVQDAGYVALMAFLGVPAALAVSMSLIEHVVTRLASLPGVLFVNEITAKQNNVTESNPV
jgi:uncharacterized protein (TIRG00374 family)